MKKRILALLLVVAMLASSALAVVHADGLDYKRPTLTRIKTLSDQITDAVYRDNAMSRIVTIYNEMQDEYEYIYTMHSLAMLRQYQNVTDEKWAEEVVAGYTVLIDAHELMRSTLVTMFSSPYEDSFRAAWGDEVVDTVLASDPMTEEERAIEAEIAEKLNEYKVKAANPSAVIDGELVTLNGTKDLDLRNKVYSLWQREMGEIYIELVTLRKKLADGGNFLADAYEAYFREYTLQNARDFEKMVADTLGDVHSKLGRLYDSSVASRLDFGMSMTELVDLTSPVLATVDKSLVDSYKLLKNNELYDIEYSDQKADMGFTITFPSYQTPFLYVQPSEQAYGLTTFYHEFGHFNQMLHSNMHEYWPGSVTDLDAMEVASQALPLMVDGGFEPYLGKEVAALLQKDNASIIVSTVISACAVDAFEQYVYSTDNLTVDLLNKKFGELVATYNVAWDDTVWTQISHIYESPGYYISYAVSAITAMEIWEQFETDPAKGRETYLAAVEACEHGYSTLLEDANLRSPFTSKELMQEIRDLIEKEFGVLVDTYGHWAEDEVDYLSGEGIINGYLGADGKSYFRPNQNVTRAEFVKLLYNLSGGSKTTYTEPFSDVKDTDWFAEPVAWASANGLVNGLDAEHFHPNGTITRQDMAVILERFLLWCRIALPSGGEADFTDANKIAAYATVAVARLHNAEILNGLPDGRFDPRGSVTRAAAATALYTTLDVVMANIMEPAPAANYAPVNLPSVPLQAKMLSMMVH